MCRQKLGLGIFLILISHLSYAEVYKWVDENGQTRFSDKPPIQNKFETLNMPSSPAPNTTPELSENERLEKQKKLLQVFDEERKAKMVDQNTMIEKGQEQHKRCIDAERRLRYVKIGALYTVDKQGNRQYKAEAERGAEVEKAELSVKRYCH